MTLTEMTKMVARNINQLADDDTTIRDGMVTEEGIQERINHVYREILFPTLSDKFPEDFEQETGNTSMYSQTGTVDATAADTSLVATTSIFSSNDVGSLVYNADDEETTRITAYTSATTVTVEDDMDDWVGDDIYILQTVYSFGGDATDLKEVLDVRVTYDGSNWYKAGRILRNDRDYDTIYAQSTPRYSLTSVDIGGQLKPAIKIFPEPTDNLAKYKIVYVEKPAALTASDEPILKNTGVSSVLVNEATAWAWKTLHEPQLAQPWERDFDKWLGMLVRGYKPVNRDEAPSPKTSPYFEAIRNRSI